MSKPQLLASQTNSIGSEYVRIKGGLSIWSPPLLGGMELNGFKLKTETCVMTRKWEAIP